MATSLRARAEIKASVLNFVGFLIFTSGFIGALAYVIHSVISGKADPGSVVLIVTLAGRLQGQVGHAIWLAGRLTKSVHVAARYLWLQDYEASQTIGTRSAPDRIRKGIRLHEVSFRYRGSHANALQNITLDIPCGSTLAIVGENGAGKTTLVKLLSKFYEPSGGTIFVDDAPLSGIRAGAWRQQMSAAYQDFAKFQLFLYENVGVGDLVHIEERAAVIAALQHADAAHFVASLDAGLDTRLGVTFDGVDLSLGQWQKLALARAFMRPHPLLFVLDEPTASLDARAEHEIFEQFARGASEAAKVTGAITVLVSHRFSTVRMADLILVIEAGQVTQLGSHKDLMSVDGSYREMYTLQARAYT
jgi:ATP-binding cassette subfamily B protein